MFKRIIASIILVVLIIGTAFPVSAASDSYTRVDVPGDMTELRLSREMYAATESITASSLGIEERLEGITDVYSDKNGNILVLCGEESRVISINSDYTLDKEITVTDSEGNDIDFNGATGIYRDASGDIYIADTSNARVLVTDSNGVLNKMLETPQSDLIPDDFIYQPISVSKDKQGYTYVLSLGCYYGVLLYSAEDEFLGFYGANTVQSTALDTLSYLWDRLTSNDTKKSNSIKKLPYSFADFSFDSEGYMVTCTGSTSRFDFGTGQIRKISHNGSDILYKRTLTGESVSASSMNFLENESIKYASTQDLVSVAVSDDDYIFALDRTHGLIYIFDSECNLMSAFGGGYSEGEQLGIFKTPVSLTLNGNSLLVADQENCSITVFEPTEYGSLLREAQTLYLRGDYDDAKSAWQEVLSLNRNCQLAYRGLAMVYYNEGDYDEALEAARIAVDYSVYDMAWQGIVSNFITENFVWLLICVLLTIAATVFTVVYLKKHNKKLITNAKLKLMLQVPFHPFQCFEDLKYRKLGSLKIAIVITVLFYVSSVLNVTSSGFLYSTTLLRNYNSLFTLASTVGLLLLWSLCNWLVCIMFSGKGSFKEVYVSTAYTLVPWILFSFIKVIISNFLPLSSSGIIGGIETVLLIYTLFLICIAMMKIHEYDFFKFLLTGLVIIFFMLLVVFVIMMCAILLKQAGTFIYSVYEEIAFR